MIKKNNTLIVLLICCSISVIFAQNISDPGNLFFCNESGYVRVDEIAATSPRFTYNFYPSATSFTSIATYDNSQDSSVINLTSADLVFTGAPPNRSTTVYVQDDCGATTFTGKLAEIDDCDRQAGINSEEKAYLFSIRATPLVIRSVSIFSSTTQNYDVSVVIKDDVGSIIYRSPRATGQAISGTEITIPMNFTLAPGATYSITTDTRVVSFGRCFPTGILRDDSNIELVREAGEDKLGNPFFNLVFEKSSPNSCDRIPFTLTESCPVSCIQNAPTISGASACMGDNLVLMATPALGTSLPVYQWYADGVAIPTATSDTYTVPTTTAATEVIYTAKVTNSTSCNTDSDFSNELPITVSQIPTFTINAPAALCSSTFDLSTTVQNLNPSGATLNYHNAITNGGTVTNPVAAIGTTTYYLAATSNGCTSARKPVTVTVDEPIIITPPTISQVCSPANVDITGTVNVSGTSITYHNGTGGTGTSVSNPTQVNTSGIYSLKATNGVCTDVKNVTVTINELPSANLTGSPLVCIGSSGDLTLEITGGSGPYDFTYNSPSTTGVAISNVARISTFPVSEVGDYTLTSLTDNKGCAATNLTSMGSLDTIPSLQVTSPLATCEISPNTNFNVTFSISGGIAPYTVTRGGSAVGSVNGSGVFTETGLDGSSANAYSYTITSGLPCTTGPTYEVVRSGTQDCSCPVVGALSGTPSICNTVPLGAVTLSLELSGATSYNATITDPNGADFAIPSASLVTGTNTITVPAANVVAGAYVLKSASENGGTNCLGSVSSTANLTIKPIPVAAPTNTGGYCAGETIALQGGSTGMDTYTWDGPAGFTSSSTNPTIPSSTAAVAGDYGLVVVKDGCTSDRVATTVLVSTKPILGITNPQPQCEGSIDLSSSTIITTHTNPGTLTYWSDMALTQSIGSSVNSSNTYYIKSENSSNAGCFDFASVSVTINTADPVTVSLSAPEFCEPTDIVRVTATTNPVGLTNSEYRFSVNGGAGSASSTDNFIDYPAGTLVDGDVITVSVDLTNVLTGCYDLTAPVTGNPLVADGYKIPVVTIDRDLAEVCEQGTPDRIVITATVTPATSKGVNEMTIFRDGISAKFESTPLQSFSQLSYVADRPSKSGSYTATANNQVCPVSSISSPVDAKVWGQPQILAITAQDETQAIPDTVTVPAIIRRSIKKGTMKDIGVGAIMFPQVGDDNYTYFWTTAEPANEDVIKFGASKNANIHLEEELIEDIILEVTNGLCVERKEYLLQVLYPLFVPNAFSPNGDGTNDFWEISGLADFPSAVVSVFNRWGNKLYEEKNYSEANAWDGENSPVGTYYYIIKLNKEGWETPLTGAVTITR